MIARLCRHLLATNAARGRFPAAVLDAIQHAIADGEQQHQGQVCLAIESALPLGEILRARTSRARAEEVFAHLHVWDTEHNSGVLIYLSIADHAIEIVADRGIAARVPQTEWASICQHIGERLAHGDFQGGALAGIADVSAVLARHFPATGALKTNELPDRPVLL